MERKHRFTRFFRRKTESKLDEQIRATAERNEKIKNEMLAMQARLEVMGAADNAEDSRLKQMIRLEEEIDALTQRLANQEAFKGQLTDAVAQVAKQVMHAQGALNGGSDSPTAQQEKFAARRRLRCKEGYIHVAIAGRSGSGKSSLVNAIRGLSDKQSGAAAVGHVETTLEIGRYEAPDMLSKVVWYDIPGAGTIKVDRWHYFKKQCLCGFEAVILVWNNRFVDTDIEILTECQKRRIPCFVVRSKCDVDLKNILRDIQDELSLSDDSDAKLPPPAQKRYTESIAAFRRDNQAVLNEACAKKNLRPQNVYLVNARTMREVVLRSREPNVDSSGLKLDERKLLEDMRAQL
eukprot:Gregarina_sp_Pseudo_9__1414@NODE_1946_length_1238_cov_27_412844_g1803_i0_p1_GENE_NODE_1946_length_1238_cov_27_412844_g1803_i0NODE_1946_length_1238_cov_27_412844_g1803_i0_p1_ORF_typecomplete_len349_score63_84IIGP/PF05049_13/6_1e02IIGP/PF05049_13/5e52MMR_HSR1/PF01926_23/5_4e07FeoB_N/PF02421_18/6_5e07ABC_tran/PF00005_27/5_7e06RsgA_GTPase/PF03193_16/4_8e05RsgA_GTPase/PF03193_16/6_2e02AIG1/PF04548_16/2_4e03AIG1/PF04548_16/0_00031Roc/PF08477_13/0_00035AAA_29/PF13555_6/0_00059KAP_NTPase/PF07693_14/9e02